MGGGGLGKSVSHLTKNVGRCGHSFPSENGESWCCLGLESVGTTNLMAQRAQAID